MTRQENRPSISMAHVACESNLCSTVRSYMHQSQGKLCGNQACVVHSARATHIFRAGIKCRHCTLLPWNRLSPIICAPHMLIRVWYSWENIFLINKQCMLIQKCNESYTIGGKYYGSKINTTVQYGSSFPWELLRSTFFFK